MSGKVRVLIGPVRTMGTLKRPDPSVCPHVPLQVPCPTKGFTTEGTFMGPDGPGVRGGPGEGWPGVPPHDHLSSPLNTHDWQLSLLPLQHINLLSERFHVSHTTVAPTN